MSTSRPTSSHTLPATTHRFGLDLARALAILLVLIAHGGVFWVPALEEAYAGAGPLSFVIGVLGVELFFALSGFLIGGLLIRLDQSGASFPQVRTFLVRRWLRTLPLYFAAILFFLIVPATEPHLQERIWSYALLSQNLFIPMPSGNWFGTSWSLTVEEWSYLFLPILAFVLFRHRHNPVLSAAILLIVMALFVRAAFTFYAEDFSAMRWDLFIRKIVISRLDAVAYGVIAAVYVNAYGAAYSNAFFIAGAVLVGVSSSMLYNVTNFKWIEWIAVFPLLGAGFALMMPAFCRIDTVPKIAPAVSYIAKISFSLYIVHWGFMWLDPGAPLAWRAARYVAGSLIVATLLSVFIEQPIMKRRPLQSN